MTDSEVMGEWFKELWRAGFPADFKEAFNELELEVRAALDA